MFGSLVTLIGKGLLLGVGRQKELSSSPLQRLVCFKGRCAFFDEPFEPLDGLEIVLIFGLREFVHIELPSNSDLF